MSFVLSNFASTVLSAGIDAVTLSIPVSNASAFTPVTGGDLIPLVIEDISGAKEIVHANALSADTFTVVVRGAEGTTPRAFAIGSRVECRITAETFATQLAASSLNAGVY